MNWNSLVHFNYWPLNRLAYYQQFFHVSTSITFSLTMIVVILSIRSMHHHQLCESLNKLWCKTTPTLPKIHCSLLSTLIINITLLSNILLTLRFKYPSFLTYSLKMRTFEFQAPGVILWLNVIFVLRCGLLFQCGLLFAFIRVLGAYFCYVVFKSGYWSI